MFEKWKEKSIAKKNTKLNKLAVFHQTLDVAHIQIGGYRTGRIRPFDILVDNFTKEKVVLTNVSIRLTEKQSLVITGLTDEGNKAPFQKAFTKDEIKWNQFTHIYNIGLNEHFHMCHNPNGGTLDLILNNGDSVLIHYTFDEEKKHELVVS